MRQASRAGCRRSASETNAVLQLCAKSVLNGTAPAAPPSKLRNDLPSTEIVGGAKTTAVGGGYQLSVQGIRHDSVLMGAYEEVGQNKTVVVGKTFEIVCGKTKLRMEEQGTITIEAEKHIVLKAKRIDLNP